MNFSEKTLDEIGTIVTGKTPPTSQTDMFGGLYPFITPTDIDGQSRLVKTERFLSEKWFNKQKNYLLPKNTICYVCIGNTIGKTCMTDKLSFSNQQINSVITNENNNPFYIYYLLNFNKNEIRTIAGGAATPIINKSIFSGFKVKVTSLKNQQKIASILSAYDDLIENNNKRIKILEEIVLSIYKKLFQGKTENGFIKNLYSLLPGYAFKSKDFADEGDAIVKIRNINEEGMVDTENVDLIPSEITQKVEKFKLNSGDILIAMTGATIGKTGIVPILEKNTFLNQRVGKFISKKSPVYISYIASYSRMSSFRKKIEAVAMGAAQPNISGSIIENFSMYIPTETELDYFCNTTEKFYREMLILRHKNTILKRIKNLLLPKLISGELDVEGLDIKIRPEIL